MTVSLPFSAPGLHPGNAAASPGIPSHFLRLELERHISRHKAWQGLTRQQYKLLCWQGAVDMCAIVLTSSTDSWPSCTCSVSVLTCLNPAVFCKVLHRRTPTAKLSGLFFRCQWLAERVCRCEARYLLSLCPFLRGWCDWHYPAFHANVPNDATMRFCWMSAIEVPTSPEFRPQRCLGWRISFAKHRTFAFDFTIFSHVQKPINSWQDWLDYKAQICWFFICFLSKWSFSSLVHCCGCRHPLRSVRSHRACPWVPAVAVPSPRPIAPSRAQDAKSGSQRQANDNGCFFMPQNAIKIYTIHYYTLLYII